MALIELAVLIVKETRATIFQKAVDIMSALGVDTESWLPGDPTRGTLCAAAVQHESKEEMAVGAIRGGFMDTAEGNWARLHGEKFYGVPYREATYASCTFRLTNTEDELHTIEIGDSVRNSSTGATYAVSALPNGDTLAGGDTLDVTITAEQAGSGGSSGVGDIDEFVSPARPGVTGANVTAAVGTDDEDIDAYKTRARGALDALSPNGPKGIYDHIATTPELNGGANVTRSRTIGNSPVGAIDVYLANDSGAVATGDVTLCQAAFEELGEPICHRVTARNSTNKVIAVTYTLWVYDSINLTTTEIEDLVEIELATALRRVPIGGDIIPPAVTGTTYKDVIEGAVMRAVYVDGVRYGFRVSVSAPSGDTSMAISEVAVLGTVTATINLIEAP